MRCYQAGDGAAYFSLIQDNKSHLADELRPEELCLVDEHEAEIQVRQLAANWIARKYFIFGVWEKELVGQVEIWPIDWTVPSFEIGYFIAKSYEGRGIITEAAKVVIDAAFVYLRAQKLVIQCKDTNPKSARVAERCGFVREGLLRDTRRTAGGDFCGMLQYGLLRSDYEWGVKSN